MRFLFTCGGTAGHINPALGVAGRIRELLPDAEILFVGAEGHMETELVPREGYEIKTVRVTGFQRSFKPAKIAENVRAGYWTLLRAQPGSAMTRYSPRRAMTRASASWGRR